MRFIGTSSSPMCSRTAKPIAATGWLGGFDVVIGNPPFLNQLETTTAQSKELATFLKRRYPGVAKGYADTAVIFAELSSQVVRADGGRFGLVQPASILASADTNGARQVPHKPGDSRNPLGCTRRRIRCFGTHLRNRLSQRRRTIND